MQKYYRNRLIDTPKYESKPTIKFQAISWEAFDLEEEENDFEYKINIFGVTDEGESISVRIDNYTPFFYVKIPKEHQSNWTDYKTKEVKNYIEKKLYGLKGSLLKVSVVLRKDIVGFTNETEYKFLKIVTSSEKAYKKCRYILYPGGNRPKPVIPLISPRDMEFEIYEANIEPFIRFCHIKNIKLSGWCEISKYNVEDLSRCQLDISCKWSNITPIEKSNIAKLRIASYDIETFSHRAYDTQKNIFPDYNLDQDVITQIGTCFYTYGTNEYIEHMCSLKSPIDKKIAPVEGVIIEEFDNEIDLINGWIKLIRKTDPDIITGYNINSFDWNYINERCKKLNMELSLAYLSRLNDNPATFKEERLVTNAYGENIFRYLYCYGMINSDLYTIIKREQKLESYKLDNVAKIHIGDQKDPLSALDIFNKSMGTSEDVATVIKYCAKDTKLVIDLIKKLSIIPNIIAMSNVTWVPIPYIESRGQQIKVHSQLLYEARLNNYLVPTLPYKDVSPMDEEEKFTGATVLEAEPGAHFEQISGLDFASLYPSIMIANNYSYETMVKNEEFDNIEDIEYKDIIWQEDVGTEKERTEKVRFVQNRKGILPIMLEKLWTERKAIKKQMKVVKAKMSKETDENVKADIEAEYSVLDGFQLAMKVSMNSIYGFTGASLGRLPEKRIAAAVTAEGRRMIKECKKLVETTYNCKVVYGDTDSIYVKFFTGHHPDTKEHMDEVFDLSQKAADACSNLFNKPVELEFEKVMWPFILFSKKRYACVIWTNKDKYDYIDYKGIQVVRRDNCPLIKEKSKRIFETILLDRDIPKSIEMAREYSKNLLEGKYPIKELVISKSLKGYGSYEFDKQFLCLECDKRWYTLDSENKKKYSVVYWDNSNIDSNQKYKKEKTLEDNLKNFLKYEHYCYTCKKNTKYKTNKANIAHVALARKMEERDPYNCPLPGERVPYVFKKTNNKRDSQFEKVEDPEYLVRNCIPVDYEYYFEHQLKSALDTIFEPILKDELNDKLYKGIVEEKQKRVRKIKE